MCVQTLWGVRGSADWGSWPLALLRSLSPMPDQRMRRAACPSQLGGSVVPYCHPPVVVLGTDYSVTFRELLVL